MQFNTPVPFSGQAKFHEGTGLASARDSRNNPQLWKKVETIAKQVENYGQAIKSIAREVSKSRRRIVGGSGSSTSVGVVFKGLWKTGTNAELNEIWILQSGTATGTYICTLPGGNTFSPDTGNGWIQIGTNQGQWL